MQLSELSQKATFWCTWHSRNFLSTSKTNLVERLNFKTKVIDDIFKNYSGSCLLLWTYLGETSCILQSSSQRHLHFQIESKNLWQQKAKNALLQLTSKMELEHKRSRLSRFVRVIVINICYSCYFPFFFYFLLMLGGPHFAISHFLIIIKLFCFMSVLALSKSEMSAKLWTKRLLRLRGGGGFSKVQCIKTLLLPPK